MLRHSSQLPPLLASPSHRSLAMPDKTGRADGLSGIWCPLVTPFRDGEVDHTALAAIARKITRTGVSGVIAAGQTGELDSLSLRERLRVAETVIEASEGVVPVYIAARSGDASATGREIAQFNLPVAGFVLSVPNEEMPRRDRLFNHFATVADATDKPIVLFDRHSRGDHGLTPELVARLFLTGRFPAVVLDGKAFENLSPIAELNGPRVLCGNESWLYITLQVGGLGGVLPLANIVPSTLCDIHDLFNAGRLDEAWAKFCSLRGLFGHFGGPTRIAAIKSAMATEVPMTEDVRLPEPGVDLGLRLRIRSELRAFRNHDQAA